MIVWSEAALERAGLSAKELLLSAGNPELTATPVIKCVMPTVTTKTPETVEQAIDRYVTMSRSARAERGR